MNSTGCATDTRMAAGLPESEEAEEEMQRQRQRQTYTTYWCHECDMSVNLISLSLSHSQCPHCNSSDFLELMDSTMTTTTTTQQQQQHQQQQDSYFLDNPTLLHRLFLLHHNDQEDNVNHFDSSSLSTITISSSMLDSDPVLLCAICKDDLLLHSQAKQLPCSHLYHSQCILPWLSSHNSCPLCRFQLPTAAAPTGTLSFRDFLRDELEQEQDWLGFSNTLRHIARRQTMTAAASGDQHLGLNNNDHNAHIILP